MEGQQYCFGIEYCFSISSIKVTFILVLVLVLVAMRINFSFSTSHEILLVLVLVWINLCMNQRKHVYSYPCMFTHVYSCLPILLV